MSFSVGIYDVFSYAIPGFLYLYVFYRAGNLFGFTIYRGATISDGLLIILFSIGAYLIGHLMEGFSYRFWYGFIYRSKIRETTLKEIKKSYPGLKIQFTHQECDVLHSIIRQRDIELLYSIEKFEVYFVILHNVGFALLVYCLLQIGLMIASFSLWLVVFALIALILSVTAFYRSVKFRKMYYKGIYLSALNYGTKLADILDSKTASNKFQKTKRERH